MRVPFIKMHGLGNDFVVLDARTTPLPGDLTSERARMIADRRLGIGCDQIVLLEPINAPEGEPEQGTDAEPERAPPAFKMRFFNSDGSEVEACGNASRAIAMLHGKAVRVQTAGGVIALEPATGGASVDMGMARFDWEAIPLAYPMDTAALPLAWDALEQPAAINVGNPHVVFFVGDAQAVDLETLGPQIECDPVFPDKINVNVADLAGPGHVRLRVWERGAGLTQACGTGACATAVAAIRRGLVASPVNVELPGGTLTIAWAPGGTIRMTGPATEAFRGEFVWEDFA